MFFFSSQTARTENAEYNRSRSYNPLIVSQDALPLKYTRLVGAKERDRKKEWENDCIIALARRPNERKAENNFKVDCCKSTGQRRLHELQYDQNSSTKQRGLNRLLVIQLLAEKPMMIW